MTHKPFYEGVPPVRRWGTVQLIATAGLLVVLTLLGYLSVDVYLFHRDLAVRDAERKVMKEKVDRLEEEAAAARLASYYADRKADLLSTPDLDAAARLDHLRHTLTMVRVHRAASRLPEGRIWSIEKELRASIEALSPSGLTQ